MKEIASTDDYFVVLNDEEQYSIWQKNKPLPSGWHKEGYSGTKDECLSFIEKNWKDIRPKSVRESLGL